MVSKKNSMTLEECVENAEKHIFQQGFCILCYDIVGSSLMQEGFSIVFSEMNKDLTNRFNEYLCNYPEIDSIGLRNKFETYSGDMASACVNSSTGVKKIIEYQQKMYREIPLRFAVAGHYSDKILKQL